MRRGRRPKEARVRDADTFAGTLTDLWPRPLLQFVGLTGKTGVLRAQGHERTVVVSFVQGRVVGRDAVAAAVELLRLGNGEFAFDEGAPYYDDDGGGGVAVAEVLAAADKLVAEWEELAQAVPSVGVVVRLRAGAGDDVRLSGDAWEVVVTVAGGAVTPTALAEHLAWPLVRACRAVKELVDGGRAELEPPSRPRHARHGRARSVVADAPAAAWHAADQPLWPGAGADTRPRAPWDDPGE
jgi:hypothetical protein